MNVSPMPSTPQAVLPKMGPLNPQNPQKPLKNGNQFGFEPKTNDFTDLLEDFGKKGKNIDSSNFKNISFDKNLLNTKELKNPNPENLISESFKQKDGSLDREIDELGKKFDPLNKLESNEVFLFQRELANRSGNKNESVHAFSKVFNLEKKDKKPELVENGETIGNLENHNKKLEGLIKENQVAEQPIKFTSPKELFNWISKVISKSQIKSGETINLQIRDNTLGEFNISAQNSAKGGEINMSIVSQNKESDEFFKVNEKDLLKSLENAGVKIGKMELLIADSSKSSANSDNMNDNKGSLSESIDNHFSQKDQLERDGQRRREIWGRYSDLRES